MLRIVSGEFGSRRIKSLESNDTRPTTEQVREAIFNRLGQYFEQGRLLDLFAGSGAVGFEALSRGMEQVTLADKNRAAVNIIKENAKTLKVENRCEIITGDYKQVLMRLTGQYDYVFIDPPYAMDVAEKIFSTLKNQDLLKENAWVIVETRKEKVFEDTYDNLEKVKEAVYGISRVTYFCKKESI